MILGLSTATFTSVHVALSLIGIVSGVIVLYVMVRGTRLDGWTALFLAATVLTSVTAFFFPSTSFGPAHVVGVLSLVVLAAAIVALYFFRLAGPWRWIYIVGAVLALYLNVFVAVVQAFPCAANRDLVFLSQSWSRCPAEKWVRSLLEGVWTRVSATLQESQKTSRPSLINS
jgi:hypothetical protein